MFNDMSITRESVQYFCKDLTATSVTYSVLQFIVASWAFPDWSPTASMI